MEIHPQLAEHGSFDHLKLGRKPAQHDKRTLELATYLDPAILPTIPPAHDLAAAVTDWPMYENDALGDCTIAAAGHMIQAWSTAAGTPKTPAMSDVASMYWETGDPPMAAADPGSATDDGRDELSVLKYWRATGLGADKIGAFVSVDPKNPALVRAAIYLFGGVYTGIALPLAVRGGHAWDVAGPRLIGQFAPGSWGGHAVPYEAYDQQGVTVITWGAPLKATWRFHAAYTEEVYAIISPDFLAEGKSPEGFDLAALTADLTALTAPAA